MINFFIKRPIFASVIAIIMILTGAVCILVLPVSQFPPIAPPQVQVTASLVGADAQTVARVVTTPLEQQINGVEGMTYMSSTSSNNGSSTITVTFEIGYDLDIAAVDVQNYAQNAEPQLPEVVLKTGVQVKKVSNNFTMVVNLISPNGTYDDVYLGNYADIHVTNALQRIPGVGQITNFGLHQYSIRIWLDPNKLASLGVTAVDVAEAVNNQNKEIVAGNIGQDPVPEGQVYQLQINAKGLLESPKDFEEIIVRTQPNGAVVRLKDVARVELGAQSYTNSSAFNGKATATLGVYQLPGANALQMAKEIRAEMERLSQYFPEDLTYTIAYDTTKFVKASLLEVVKTLFEAMFLVIVVVFIFLQNWRATLIPIIAIPVSLIGTFALLKIFGFSINTLSLLGMVLAIGLVVDDAIVVVENVQRQMQEGNKDLKDATRVAMNEVKGPIIATTLVLMAVFVPVAFIPGLTGQMYNQFSLTIAFSVLLSGINSLSLSPALCAVFLRPHQESNFFFFKWFNNVFHKLSESFKNSIKFLSRFWYIVLTVFIALIVLTILLFKATPTGFVPEEDQGYLFVVIAGPPASSMQQTQKTMKKVGNIIKSTAGVEDVLTVTGFNIITAVNEPSAGLAIPILKPWDERTTQALSANGLIKTLQNKFDKEIPEAQAIVLNAPPIQGLSTTGGFQMELQDINNLGLETLNKAAQELVKKANQRPELQKIFTTLNTNVPQLFLDIDRTKAKSLELSLSNVFDSLQIYLGSLYINNYNKYSKVYQVILQAEGTMRNKEEDIYNYYVRNNAGKMVPLGAFTKVESMLGPFEVEHYNIYTSAMVQGGPATGYSPSAAIKALVETAEEVLPKGIGYSWTGTTYQAQKAGNLAPIVFLLSLVFVFLFLAAQYESWLMPFMILLAVPLAMLGAVGALMLRDIPLDIYGQIGLIMLIGLAAKNAILIVEFAKRRREEGAGIIESAMDAAKLRLRPILMTAFAFIFGVLPLAIATGAGAVSRHSIGTTVVGGMLLSTFLSLFIVPVFYVVLETVREHGFRKRKKVSNGKKPKSYEDIEK